jgi:hypothetical protein
MSETTREHPHSCSELECGPGRRNRYFKGKRMTYQAFALEQDYLVRRRQLLNHALYGWGVVSGFRIGPKRDVVGAGLALDRHGRELLLPEAWRLDPRDCFLEGEAEEVPLIGRWVLRAHYAERLIGEQLLPADCGCEDVEWNEVCETVVFSLKRLEKDEHCPPGERPCPVCKCRHEGDCCPQRHERHEHHEYREHHEHDHPPEHQHNPDCEGHARHSHACECQWAEWAHSEERDELHEWRKRKVRFALCDPVPLACILIGEDECRCLVIESVDECAPRRLVKRNDALFDLIRGCDLTRICDVSWRHWHRPGVVIPWDRFRRKFHNSDGTPAPALTDDQRDARPHVTDFKVWFSRPVEARTVRWDCFTISATLLDKSTGWGRVKNMPIVGVCTELSADGLPARFTNWATLVMDRRWIADEVRGVWSSFDDGPTTIQIEIRGDYILDCHGQAVSGAALGFRPFPSGNDAPGGTFVSRFRVSTKPDSE